MRNKVSFNPKKGRKNILDTVSETHESLPPKATNGRSTKNNLYCINLCDINLR